MEEELILIVDDNLSNLQILGKILQKNEYQIALADDGQEALQFIENRKPDLILLDIMMPGLDGFEVAEKIKADGKELPIIFISALKEIEDKVKAFQSGGVDYITKPFHRKEVVARVENQLQLARTKKRLKEEIRHYKNNEQSLQAVLATAKNISLIITAPDEKNEIELIQEFSLSSENIFGYLREEIIGQPFALLCDQEGLVELELKQEIRGDKSKKTELLRKNGESFPVLYAFYPLENNEREEIVRVFVDISQLEDMKYEIEEKNLMLQQLYEVLDREFEKGVRLHNRFLPKQLPKIEGLSISSFFQPAAKLGGDFYDVIKIGQQLIIYLADVGGHGLDSSILNIFLRETINDYLLKNDFSAQLLDPSEIVRYIFRKYQAEDFPEDYIISLLFGVIDLDKQEFRYTNAGFHILPIVVEDRKRAFSPICCGLPISSAVDKELFNGLYKSSDNQQKIDIKAGTVIFLASNGIFTEVDNKLKTEEVLEEVITENSSFDALEINKKIRARFKDFSGAYRGRDDIAFLIIKNDK